MVRTKFPVLVAIVLGGVLSCPFECSEALTTPDEQGLEPPAGNTSVVAELIVRNRARTHRTAEPLTAGTPIPKALNVHATHELSVVNDEGPVATQMRVLSRWGGSPDDRSRPIKWVLLHWQASLESHGHASYRLVRNVKSTDDRRQNLVVSKSGEVVVDTGPARFSIDHGGMLRVSLPDTGRDNRVDASGATVSMSSFVRKTASSAKPAQSGLARVTVEENGPLRAVVLVTEDPISVSGCQLILQHRLHFYRDKSFVRVFHTLTNKTAADYDGIDKLGRGNCFIQALGSELHWKPSQERTTVLLGGESSYETSVGKGDLVKLYQDSSGKDRWNVPGGPYSFRGYRIYKDGKVVSSGNHASGWLDASDGKMGVTVAARHFWQNNPKTLQANGDGMITVGLWPEEFSKPHWIFGGFRKTHEMLYYFHKGSASDAHTAEIITAFQDPLIAQASPQYYAGSGALGATASEDRKKFSDYERLIDAQIDTSAGDSRSSIIVSNIDKRNVYGIEFFGDTDQESDTWTWTTRQMSNLEQDGSWAMLLAFARKGDLRFFDIATSMARHSYDIDINHATTGVDLDRKYEGADRKHGTYNIDNGAELTHVWLQGLLTYYYFTGDSLALEGAHRIADNVVYRINSNRDAARNEERVPGWAIKALVQFYDATHEQKYLDAAIAMKNKVLASQHPSRGYFDSEKSGVNPWMCAVLVEALYELWDITGRRDNTLRASIIHFAAWLKNDAWSSSYNAFPSGWMSKQGGYRFSNNDRTVNTLMAVDAMVIGYWLTGDGAYMDIARKAFQTGTHYPWGDYYVGFSDAKVSAKQMRGGHRYLYQKTRQGIGETENAGTAR